MLLVQLRIAPQNPKTPKESYLLLIVNAHTLLAASWVEAPASLLSMSPTDELCFDFFIRAVVGGLTECLADF